MLDLSPAPDDDPEFVECVARLIEGALMVHRPVDVRAFRIDNWFDHKWLRFSGYLLPWIGVWQRDLTLPPFVANRIVSRSRFRRDDGGMYARIGFGSEIHHRGWSVQNLRRRVRLIVPDTALFWYSGNTLDTGRGSLMGYIPVEGDHWAWFLAFVRDGSWQIARRKNIHEFEVRAFQVAGDRVRQDQATP
jgi:hypothetical protein